MGQTFYNMCKLDEKLIKSFNNEIKQRNFYDERLLRNWKDILSNFAEKIHPIKIIFNGIYENNVVKKTLYIGTYDRQFATEFLFYKHALLEKLNQYFGTEKSFFDDIKLKTFF